MAQLLLVLVIVAVAIGFCVPRDDKKKEPEPGRAETEYLEKVEPVYQEAGAIRKKLDTAIEQTQNRPQDLDAAIQQQEAQAAQPAEAP